VQVTAGPVPATTLRYGDPAEAGMAPERTRHLAELARGWVDQDFMQCLVVLVARRGVIVLHEAYGRQGPGSGSPTVALDSIFPMSSLTKVFTATAVMLLVEEGEVGLNRPVLEYIPEFAGEGKDGVLVHHLLTHTSGLNDGVIEAYVKAAQVRVPITPSDSTQHPLMNEYLAARYGSPLWKPPGTEMSYANLNIDLAGEIVRRVSGQAIGDFAAARIFQPLGMKDTQYCRLDVPGHRRAWIGPDPRVTFDEARETERILRGAGGLWTTAADMAIFGQMFLNRGAYGDARILSRASVAAMTRNQIPGIPASYNAATDLPEFFPEASWGLGWSVHGNKLGWNGGLFSPESFEHGGGSGVYAWVDPIYEIVGVYFSIVHDPSSLDRNAWPNDLFTDAVTASVVEV